MDKFNIKDYFNKPEAEHLPNERIFIRADQDKQEHEIDASGHIFNVLLAVSRRFDQELEKRFLEKKLKGDPATILILEKEKEEELLRIQREVDKKIREIEDRYKDSLSKLESDQKDGKIKSATEITDRKYTAKVDLDKNIKELEEWMDETLAKF